jgi:hypothetical protein
MRGAGSKTRSFQKQDFVKLVFGAPDKNRTRDLRFTKPLLYQLSYKGYLFVAGGILTCF